MKHFFVVFLSVITIGCTQQPGKSNVPKSVNPEVESNVVKYEHKLDSIGKDSINISAAPDNSIFYKSSDLKDIIRHRPELVGEFIDDPEVEYEKGHLSAEELDVQQGVDYSFSSEVGQDGYYAVYAYFLRFRNGDKTFTAQRTRLIKLYSDINSIFQKLANGGTYFGHQETRIMGDAEYALTMYPKDKNDNYYAKQYDISLQKQLFTASLKQYINDELAINNYYLGKDKTGAKAELYKTVADIDGLITEYFYLKMAQRFRYAKY